MRWFNRYNFPYSNFHDLNLDWIIKEMTRVVEEWEQVKAEWEQMKIEWAEFQAEMQRLWEDYKALMNAAWEAYKAQMNQEWADYKDEMDAAWDAYQAELNAQWLAYQNNLNAAWAAYQTSMNAWKDGVDEDIQDKFDEIDEKCRQCKAEVDAAIATLNGLLASVQQQVTDYLNNLPYQTIIHDTALEWLEEHGVTVSSGVILPEDYGAVGDGITDDTNALRDAFAAARDENKPLFLGQNKNYTSSITNTVYSGMVIYGNNSTITAIDGTGQPDPRLKVIALMEGCKVYDLKTNANTIEIKGSDVTLDGFDAPNTYLTTSHTENELYSNITISNCRLDSLRLEKVANSNVNNLIFRSKYGDVLYANNASNINISNVVKLSGVGNNKIFNLTDSIVMVSNIQPQDYVNTLSNSTLYKADYTAVTQ